MRTIPHKPRHELLRWLSLAFVAVLIVSAYIMVEHIDQTSAAESVERIEDAIRKAAVTCYAIEGAYPPLDHLVAHYGIVLSPDRYYYHYEMVASNIAPVIRVIPRWDAR